MSGFYLLCDFLLRQYFQLIFFINSYCQPNYIDESHIICKFFKYKLCKYCQWLQAYCKEPLDEGWGHKRYQYKEGSMTPLSTGQLGYGLRHIHLSSLGRDNGDWLALPELGNTPTLPSFIIQSVEMSTLLLLSRMMFSNRNCVDGKSCSIIWRSKT